MEKSILTIKSTELCQSAYRLASDVQKKQKEYLLTHQLLENALQMGVMLQNNSKRRLTVKLFRARQYGVQIGFVLDLLLTERTITTEQYEAVFGVLTEVSKMVQASLTTIYKGKKQSQATQSNEAVV